MKATERKSSVKSRTVLDNKNIRYSIVTMLRKSFPVTDSFPTDNRQPPLIPHIIHQTHWDTNIPKDEVEYVRSVVKHTANWKYYFWTDAIARKLIKDRHPGFLPTWDSYDKGIKRGDALQYFVLYEFGGVYMDLDFVVYKPLDQVTGKYSCIIPPEPLEQGLFLFASPIVLNNGIMLCRPKHPFFKHMIENLGQRSIQSVLEATGPAFVTDAFFSYIRNVSANGLYDLAEEHHGITFKWSNSYHGSESDIHIASTVFFNDELGRKKNQGLYQTGCVKKKRSENVIIACNEIIARGLHEKGITISQNIADVQNSTNYYDKFCPKGLNSPIFDLKCDEVFKAGLLRSYGNYTFTSHKFYHSWVFQKTVEKKPNVYIGDVVPHVILYS